MPHLTSAMSAIICYRKNHTCPKSKFGESDHIQFFKFSRFHSVYHLHSTLSRSQPNSTECLWHAMPDKRFGTSSARIARSFRSIASKLSLSMSLFDGNLLHDFCIYCSPAPFSGRSVGLTTGLSLSHRQPYPHSCPRLAYESGVLTE